MLFHMAHGNMLNSRNIDDIWQALGLHGFEGDPIGAANDAVQNLIADRKNALIEQVPPRNVKLSQDGLFYCRQKCREVLGSMNLGMPP